MCVWAVRPLVSSSAFCLVRLVNSSSTPGRQEIQRSAHALQSPPIHAAAILGHQVPAAAANVKGPFMTSRPENCPYLVYTGDSAGRIRCWDISSVFISWNVLPYPLVQEVSPATSNHTTSTSGSATPTADGSVHAAKPTSDNFPACDGKVRMRILRKRHTKACKHRTMACCTKRIQYGKLTVCTWLLCRRVRWVASVTPGIGQPSTALPKAI